jgi:phosphoglycolate phosphatase
VQIAKQLGIPPRQFLYLGDSDIDMKTAAAAEMFPAGATWGFRTAEELKAAGARALVHHPIEILRLVSLFRI